ncbi:MAG: hypothetical protein ACFFED_14080 [Candidatus Thorarchaeota archaeon]
MKTKETDWSYITVRYDENTFTIEFDNDKEHWEKSYQWTSISRVCFKSYDYGAPHFCYLYFSDSPDEIIMPVEEQAGCVAFWNELKAKGLFDPSKEKYAEYSSIPEFNCHDVE